MTLQWLIEILFYLIVTFPSLWNICHICAVTIFFLYGKYMSTLLENLLNLVHILQSSQLWAFSVPFNFPSLFNQHYGKIKTKKTVCGCWCICFLCTYEIIHLFFGLGLMYVCGLLTEVGWRQAADGLGIPLSWAYLVLVLLVKFLSVLFSAF